MEYECYKIEDKTETDTKPEEQSQKQMAGLPPVNSST